MRTRMLVLAVLAIIAGYAAAGLYAQGQPRPRQEIMQVLSVSALVIMGLAGIELALGRQDIGDTAVRFWLLAATMTSAGRMTVNGAHALLRRGVGPATGNTLIVGAGRVGHLAAKRLLEDRSLGMRPIGFLDKDPLRVEPDPDSEPVPTLPVLGASYDLEQVVRDHDVEHVLVAFSTAPSHVVLDMVRRCWALGVLGDAGSAPVRGRGHPHPHRAPRRAAARHAQPVRSAWLAVRGQVRVRPRRSPRSRC